jgi:hypothetical protein
MSQLSSFVSCPNVQESLAMAWGYDNLKLGNVNLVRFLLSDINKSDVIQNQINFRAGGLKGVEVVYGQRFLESSVSESGRVSCSGFSVDGETSKVYEIDPTIGASFGLKLTLSDLQTRCEADSTYLGREVLKLMNALIQKMETDAALAVIGNSGNFASDVIDGNAAGTTSVKITKTKTAGGSILTNAIEDVAFENMANEFTQTPFVFGGAAWEKYAKALGAACCGDLGVDAGVYSTNSGVTIVYTPKIQTNSAEVDYGYSIIPGTVQVITYNEFGGEGNIFAIDDDALKQGTITHPELPLTFDYYAKYTCTNANTKVWEIGVALAYDFIFLPADMYQAGDVMEGVNGVLAFDIDN